MNKVELLPKDFYYKDDLYQLSLWVTAWNKLCIGYRNALASKHDSLFCVCVEPQNEPTDIKEPGSGWLNEGIGNTRNIDDACDMLQKYINSHHFINN